MLSATSQPYPGGPNIRGRGDPRLYSYPGGSGRPMQQYPSYSGPSFSPGGASSWPHAPLYGGVPYYGRPGPPSYRPYYAPYGYGGAPFYGCPNGWC